ncbi:polysaccharide pyruvyl transferase family protein, partial [Brachyspira intermedia]|uniref:polysaccharide pyruvyl transferase family protein n=1 Tax=Brachyspira intermedia TaxID=84377 RepID=UPI0030043B41
MSNVNILDKSECSGCSVCYKICPHNAIEMVENNYGFLHPVIDDKKCTNCNICVQRCHALNNDNFKEYPTIYSAIAKDEKLLMQSSSGAAFPILANYVLDNNGYVCGASFDKDWNVEHIIVDNKDDLVKLKGSKYIESNASKIFDSIKTLLNENKLVLFSGCPCEVSSLLMFLNKKYENLITVDLLCHGVPPNKLWQKYLKENHDKSKITYISFRDKRVFRKGPFAGMYIEYSDGTVYIARQYSSEYNDVNDSYCKLFFGYYSCKDECIKCKYRDIYRVADISIGDNGQGECGVSSILINTESGEKLFNKIKDQMEIEKIDYDYKIGNHALDVGVFTLYGNRKYLFDNLDKIELNNLAERSLDIKHNVGLVTMCFQNNYGAILTSFALYKVVEKLGFNPVLIFPPDIYEEVYKIWSMTKINKELGIQFAKKYLNTAIFNNSNYEIYRLNNLCDSFVVGSDGVWNPGLENHAYFNMLNFVNIDKKIISYSSSFGMNIFTGRDYHKLISCYYLNRFDRISVREDSGVNICKDTFNIDAIHVLDPVFLLNIMEYEELIKKSNFYKNKKLNYKYGSSYFVRSYDLSKKNNIIKYISKKINLEFKNIILKDDNVFINENTNNVLNFHEELSVEDYLYVTKNSDFIITNSFHGICFAIIYNKDFIFIDESTRKKDPLIPKDARIESILRMLNLEDRIIFENEDISLVDSILEKKIDYVYINNKLEEYINFSINYLKEALNFEKIHINNRIKELDNMVRLLLVENNKLVNQNINLINMYRQLNCFINKEPSISNNWIKLFGIYNDKNYIYIYIFGIKITIKNNEKNINKIVWWIPVKKWRDNFRKNTRPDQTRPDQTRTEQNK